MESPLLSVENVTVSFDGFNALDGMSLRLMPASIRVLIGPNGAGKSTLLDAIIGHVRPSSGKVMFKGRDITRLNEYRIVRKGICRKFQAPGILDSLTVEENLNLAARQQTGMLAVLRRWAFQGRARACRAGAGQNRVEGEKESSRRAVVTRAEAVAGDWYGCRFRCGPAVTR